MDELIHLFSLERVNKSGARFDPEKTKWFNQQYLRKKSDAELAALYMPILKEKGVDADASFVESVVSLVKERATFVSDFWVISSYFFVAPTTYDEKVVAKFWKENVPALIAELREKVAIIAPFTQENIDKVVHEWVAEKQLPMGQVMNNFRLCLVGASMGPGVAQMAALMGKEETLKRLDAGLKNIKA